MSSPSQRVKSEHGEDHSCMVSNLANVNAYSKEQGLSKTEILASKDVGRVIFFRALTCLEESLAGFLSELLPELFNNAVERKASGGKRSLSLNELFDLWRYGLDGDNSTPDEIMVCHRKTYFKLKSLVTMVRKRRNAFAHGEIFLPSSLKGVLHAAANLMRAISSSQLEAPWMNTEQLSSRSEEKREEWSAMWWRIHCLQSHTVSTTSRLFQSTTRELVGRDALLSRLVHILTKHENFDREQSHRILLHGARGVGKTAVVRELAKRLASNFPRQYSFQASSEQALLADIRLFLSCQGYSNSEDHQRLFRSHLHSSESLFLIFEDVPHPLQILPLLPEGRHSVIMTSKGDLSWATNPHVDKSITKLEVSSLSTRESLLLMEEVFIHCRKREQFQAHMHGIVNKRRIVKALEEDLKNIPLAVRLFSYQLAHGLISSRHLFQQHPLSFVKSSERSEEDEQAAGSLHVRGFHHAVRSSLGVVSCDAKARLLCFACSLLPKTAIHLWFLWLVGDELGLSRHETERKLSSLIRLGLLTKVTTESANDQQVSQHCVVQQHIRKIMSLSGKGFLSAAISLIQKAIDKKMSFLWGTHCPFGEGRAQRKVPTFSSRKESVSSLGLEECGHLKEIISTLFRHSSEVQLEYSEYCKLKQRFRLLRDYCGTTWHLSDPESRVFKQLFSSGTLTSATTGFRPKNISLLPVLTNWFLACPTQLLQTIVPLLTSLLEESSAVDDDLLRLVVFLCAKHGKHHLICQLLLHHRLNPGVLLRRYLSSGNFACVSTLLCLCESFLWERKCLEFTERMFHKVFYAWMQRGYEKGLWWELSDICTVGCDLAKQLCMSGNFSKTFFWCEAIFGVLINTQSNIQPFPFSMRIVSNALRCCASRGLPRDHNDFLKWFCRFLQLKESPEYAFLCKKDDRFAYEALAYSWIYVNRYCDSHGKSAILPLITRDFLVIAKEEAKHFLDELCQSIPLRIKKMVMFSLLIGLEHNQLEPFGKLMTTLKMALQLSPTKCSELLEFPRRMVDCAHRLYFALSPSERCFLLGMRSVVVNQTLNELSQVSLKSETRPLPGSCHDNAESKDCSVPLELSGIFNQCLSKVLSQTIVEHVLEPCFTCFERMEKTPKP